MSLKYFFGAAALSVCAATSSLAASIDLGFAIDASGSVGSGNFNLTRNALADALSNIPTVGANEYRIAVTRFSFGASIIIAPTVVTADNIASLQDTLRATNYIGGGTNTSGAIDSLTSAFQATGSLGDTTLFNITTDGRPNSQTATETAALNAFNAGVDGISFEALGGGLNSGDLENMRRIASIGTTGGVSSAGAILTDADNIPTVTETGFVIRVEDFSDYQFAINAKVEEVVQDVEPPSVPLPASIPLLLSGLGACGVLRLRRKSA